MIAAFSRSRRPMRPISLESVIWAPGMASAKSSPARFSKSPLTGEKTEVMAIERMPLAAMSLAIPFNSSSLSGLRSPGRRIHYRHGQDKCDCRSTVFRSSGQSTIGSGEAVAGRPRRTAAVWARSRRCTTALVKWVVPIITKSTADASIPDAASTSRSA